MSQPWGYSCKGGLNVNLNQLEMLAQPGFATALRNFEVDPDGGYRRLNGFTLFGDTKPNSSETNLGMAVYADGIIVCSGTDIFFSVDGEDAWLQINKASVASGGDNYTAFTGRSAAARTSQGRCTFAIYEGTSDYGEIVICDGVNEPFLFQMTGTGGLESRTFFAKEITVSGTTGPAFGIIHDKHLVVAGASTAKNTVYYSKTNDIDSFTGSGSGSIVLSDAVVGLASFRSDVIIFCKNSIHKLVNINDATNVAIVPITTNVGCVDGGSIQEVGGDILFLAPDGIRTIAGTARIGDIELSSVSRPIQKIVSAISRDSNFIVTSGVLRSKSQYRLFYSKNGETPSIAKGIIGTFTSEGFAWSETLGIQALGFISGVNIDGIEKIYHADKDGYIYNHDTGNSFYAAGQATNIASVYETTDFDFGDVGTRKTLKYAKVSFSPEGAVLPSFRVKFDYHDITVPQPEPFVITGITLPALFGSAIFNNSKFGATKDPMERITLEGSGHTCSFKITTDDQLAAFAVNGVYIDYMPAGRR